LNVQKRKKKIVCVAVLACVVAVAFLAVLCSRDGGKFAPHETKPLIEVLDSANMMLVTPVGLGDRAKGKVISGRTYQNFVQLLRLADAKETLLDTFHTECATGVRVQFFHDTLSVAELRIAEKIGRIGDDIGVWEPDRPIVMRKINQFIRHQGVNFRPCAIKDSTTDALESLILENDTAISTPLHEIATGANRARVSWGLSLKCDKPTTTELTKEEFNEFVSLLHAGKESFSGACLCLPYATIGLYRDSVKVMTLYAIGRNFERMEKRELDFHAAGVWSSTDPQSIGAFFNRLKQRVEGCTDVGKHLPRFKAR
jgi:hypothetical protein